jgi:hypothetical protein
MSEPARSQPPRHPSLEPSTPWSVEASREIFEEMARPPADTPERRATFKRAAEWRQKIDRLFEDDVESSAE